MGVVGDLSKYAQFQAAEAMRTAAANPGDGGAAAGMGLGMGMAMAQQMANAMNPAAQAAQPASSASSAPPPIPQAARYHVARDGQATGPFDMASLSAMAGRGELARDTLVWTEGMANWEKASARADLSAVFGSAPPPIPGGGAA
ncbi:MAG: DUF4339 domain-containing protein [Geminicoccaceae bacterium]